MCTRRRIAFPEKKCKVKDIYSFRSGLSCVLHNPRSYPRGQWQKTDQAMPKYDFGTGEHKIKKLIIIKKGGSGGRGDEAETMA